MHDFIYKHDHEISDADLSGCCAACAESKRIVVSHLRSFYETIQRYDDAALAALSMPELYQLYLVLDDLAHLHVQDSLSTAILADPEVGRMLPTIRSYYSLFFSLHERGLAHAIISAPEPWEVLRIFALYPRYEALMRSQVERLPLAQPRRVAFIGSGPVPLSGILLADLYGIDCVCVDSDQEAVELSRRVIRKLGLQEHVAVACGDERVLTGERFDCVLLAALAEPKQRIFSFLHDTLNATQTPVVFRTYTGMRAVLSRPVEPEDHAGFTVRAQVEPSGRVNNTIVCLLP